jgi:hypothetical protein
MMFFPYISKIFLGKNERNNGLEPDRNYLCDDRVYDIIERYQMKLLWVGDTFLFRDQGEESGIEGLQHLS